MFRNRKKSHDGADKLANVAFFEGFTSEELDRVAELAEDVEAEQGATLIDQGRVGQECYVILDGQAGVYAADEHIATLEAGSMVGEMALVDHRPRSATVIAETPLQLIAFDTRAFKQLLEEMPKANERVMALLSTRIRPNQ